MTTYVSDQILTHRIALDKFNIDLSLKNGHLIINERSKLLVLPLWGRGVSQPNTRAKYASDRKTPRLPISPDPDYSKDQKATTPSRYTMQFCNRKRLPSCLSCLKNGNSANLELGVLVKFNRRPSLSVRHHLKLQKSDCHRALDHRSSYVQRLYRIHTVANRPPVT